MHIILYVNMFSHAKIFVMCCYTALKKKDKDQLQLSRKNHHSTTINISFLVSFMVWHLPTLQAAVKLRSKSPTQITLRLLTECDTQKKKFCEAAFCSHAPKIWAILPPRIRPAISVESFQSRPKTLF